jgi:hypothetical protein
MTRRPIFLRAMHMRSAGRTMIRRSLIRMRAVRHNEQVSIYVF